MTSPDVIRWEQDGDGVVVLTLDDPARSANTMNESYARSMDAVLTRLEAERDAVSGVILTSAKKTFLAGGDLHALVSYDPARPEVPRASADRAKRQLRRLEELGRPVVAAISGSALGGGLELALACHHRIALDGAHIEIGLPEVTLGLLPAGGGVVRAVRLLGIADALAKVLLTGARYAPAQALEIGLVDELVGSPEDLLGRARRWLAANPDARQPWDAPGGRPPGDPPALAEILAGLPPRLRKQVTGAPYPAPHHILHAAAEGALADFETAAAIESRYFADLACGQVAKNMIGALFFDLQAVTSRGRSPGGQGRWRPARAAVLGAGMMGAAIACVCACAGLEIMLKDVSVAAAERGKGYAVTVLDKALAGGRIDGRERDEVLARIHPAADVADLAGCELVIEAVFEDPDLKRRLFAEVQHVVAPGALLASNTSTLPITALAGAVARPEDFIGLHFFSPVDKMPLVEIITGRKTSEAALHRALDVVRQLRKTPIVVSDSRGFFTSRVIGTFTREGIAMVGEGLDPALVEQASTEAGYPAPVLALLDELTLTLPRQVREQTRAAVQASGAAWTPHPADAVVDAMIDDFGREGRSAGAGFYEYSGGRRQGLWPGLYEHFATGAAIPALDMTERMLFIEAIEAVHCVDEGVLSSAADANVGSILGIGFPAWTGGVLRYIDQYLGGLAGFAARAAQLADRYGERFTPPPLLLAMAERGESFSQ
jgi:3-hydroxyacyl-CoA dehydrogenase/enoyl-CoA hydratase/3-hydroxybutyryl-CoA epimerase